MLFLPLFDTFLPKKIPVAGKTYAVTMTVWAVSAGIIIPKSVLQRLLSVNAFSLDTAANILMLASTAVLWLIL
jgi:hypothetical protein